MSGNKAASIEGAAVLALLRRLTMRPTVAGAVFVKTFADVIGFT